VAAKYFYIKNGFGTRTTGGGFTSKQTGSFATLGAASVYSGVTSCLADTAPPVAGDFMVFSNSHAFSNAGALTYTIPGGVFLVSVDDANCDTYSAGASETTTGANPLRWDGSFYMRGLTLSSGTTGTTNLSLGLNAGPAQVYKDCKLRLGSSNGASRIAIGTSTAQAGQHVRFINTTVRFAASGQSVTNNSSRFDWIGGGIESGGTAPTQLISGNSTNVRGVYGTLMGLNLAGLATTGNIFSAVTTTTAVSWRARNISLPASWSGALCDGVPAVGARYEMYNFDNGATNYKLWVEDVYGSIREDTVRYLSAGETDGTTHIAWKMTTSANASSSNGGLISPEIGLLYSTTGAKTPVIELLTDGQLTDADIYSITEYLGSSSNPLATVLLSASDALAGASNLTAGAGTGAWASTTGITTPTSSKLAPSFTVNLKGYTSLSLALTKPSTTIYVNPGAT